MIARGNMGIEVPLKWIQFAKMIITKVNAVKVVITANMLETMTEKPRATRSHLTSSTLLSMVLMLQ